MRKINMILLVDCQRGVKSIQMEKQTNFHYKKHIQNNKSDDRHNLVLHIVILFSFLLFPHI